MTYNYRKKENSIIIKLMGKMFIIITYYNNITNKGRCMKTENLQMVTVIEH